MGDPWDGGPFIINPIYTLYSGYLLVIWRPNFKVTCRSTVFLGQRIETCVFFHHMDHMKSGDFRLSQNVKANHFY